MRGNRDFSLCIFMNNVPLIRCVLLWENSGRKGIATS